MPSQVAFIEVFPGIFAVIFAVIFLAILVPQDLLRIRKIQRARRLCRTAC